MGARVPCRGQPHGQAQGRRAAVGAADGPGLGSARAGARRRGRLRPPRRRPLPPSRAVPTLAARPRPELLPARRARRGAGGVTILELAGRSVELTTPDRVLWPRVGYTKQDLLDYYLRIAPVLLPHLADRPLTLGRFPHGVEARGFAQTEGRDAPDWLRTVPIRLRNGEIRNYCVVEDEAGLAWLANRSVVELHPFLGLDRPHAVVFDLDPGEPATVVDCADVALLLRERLPD